MKIKKQITVIILLSLGIALSFGLPKKKYKSPDILPKLKIPSSTREWYGKDVSKSLNLEDERYKFVSDIFAHIYVNKYRENILFIILDAGNFHHPKVCFSSAGAKVKELPDTKFNILGRSFNAHTLYTKQKNKEMLIIYWLCVDKKVVNWTEQKFKLLWFSFFNKEKTGLMVRLDIPTSETGIKNSLKTAQEFLTSISETAPEKQIDYLFGKKQSIQQTIP